MRISRKKYITVLGVSALVFALVCLGALAFSRDTGGSRIEAGEHPLRISEIMASNSICPDENGAFCDWIEIENLSDRDFNISGYRLSDDLTEAKYSFPVGTIIPAGDRLWFIAARSTPVTMRPWPSAGRGAKPWF